MSPLLERQVKFASMVPRLIDYARGLGYLVTLGDAYRDPRVFGAQGTRMGYGQASSAHKIRLAIDLNLFKPDGTFLQNTEDHRRIGEWWEAQGGVWGGRFDDGNHYSLEFNGVA